MVVVKLAGREGSGGLLLIRSGVVVVFVEVEEEILSGGGLIISGLGVPGCDPAIKL